MRKLPSVYYGGNLYKNKIIGNKVGDILNEVILEMKNIHKQFPGVYALKDINLDLKEGEVHALLGENGAGKSTLIKVLGGIYKPEQGEIYIDGHRVNIESVRDAQKYGISIIHQELLLVPEMTVADNIFLDSAPTNYGYIDRKSMEMKAQKALESMGILIDAGALVSS